MTKAVIALLALLPLSAGAEVALTIPVPVGKSSTTIASPYSCENGTGFSVQYINTEDNFLAVFEVAGGLRVFASSVSASGVRYVSGEYEWHTKGDEAVLSNVLEETALACKVSEGG